MNVLDWLLDSDPSIRWQVIRDLTAESRPWHQSGHALPPRVGVPGCSPSRSPRASGTGAPINRDGPIHTSMSPAWTSTTYTLLLLRDLGLDPASEEARRAVALVRDNSKWEHDGQDFFAGESSPASRDGRGHRRLLRGTGNRGAASRHQMADADGTASRRTAQPEAHSTAPFRSWRASLNTRRRRVAPPR